MPNKSNSLDDASQRFIEEVARLLVPWGVPRTAARLYGYLLLVPAPVGLDQLRVDLELSKSSASVAARLLEQYRLALRHGEPGSKRVLYEASQNYDGMLTEQARLLAGLGELLTTSRGVVADTRARARLEQMADFYALIRDAMDAALQRWQATRRR